MVCKGKDSTINPTYDEIKSQIINLLNTKIHSNIILYGRGNNGKTYLIRDLMVTGVIDESYKRNNNVLLESNYNCAADIQLNFFDDNRYILSNTDIIIDMNHLHF